MKIEQQDYQRRRQQLLEVMGADSILVLPSALEKVRNRDCHYPFRQSSDFYYLSGFAEPEAVLVLAPGRAEGECVLFCRSRDPNMEIWNGRRAGQKGAVEDFGFDQAYAFEELDERMPMLLNRRQVLFYSPGQNRAFDRRLWRWIDILHDGERRGKIAPSRIDDRDKIIHRQRQIKSSAEIAVMRRAGEISAKAHIRAMQECRPQMMEYQLEAAIHHEFAYSGARYPAYTTIVGGGENACILHYTENNCALNDGDLVLIDAGCELDCYAADITRTFPVNGRFSEEQKALYNVVLAAQQAAIAEIAPGKPWRGFHDAALRVLTKGLVTLGLLQGDVDELLAAQAYRPFYMHGTGHWLGMDVHDVGAHTVNGQDIAFAPGMALTVEPGLYVAPNNQSVEPRWRGIGIRIEDNVVVTDTGCEVLTADVPKTVAEIEALMAAG